MLNACSNTVWAASVLVLVTEVLLYYSAKEMHWKPDRIELGSAESVVQGIRESGDVLYMRNGYSGSKL